MSTKRTLQTQHDHAFTRTSWPTPNLSVQRKWNEQIIASFLKERPSYGFTGWYRLWQIMMSSIHVLNIWIHIRNLIIIINILIIYINNVYLLVITKYIIYVRSIIIYESYSIFTRSTLNTTYMDSIYKIRAPERSLEELEYE